MWTKGVSSGSRAGVDWLDESGEATRAIKNWVDAAECGQDTAMLSKRRSIGEPLSWPRCDKLFRVSLRSIVLVRTQQGSSSMGLMFDRLPKCQLQL